MSMTRTIVLNLNCGYGPLAQVAPDVSLTMSDPQDQADGPMALVFEDTDDHHVYVFVIGHSAREALLAAMTSRTVKVASADDVVALNREQRRAAEKEQRRAKLGEIRLG